MTNREEFSIFMTRKRKEKNLTQEELANMLYVTPSTVSKWERGISSPDIALVPEICRKLEITEHEFFTACDDLVTKKEKLQARKFRTINTTYNMFFFIAYGITILTCFIVNLATSGKLDWFCIVLSALILAFTFTSLSQFVPKYKLLVVTLSNLLALILLLGICCIYSSGTWFLLAITPIVFAFIAIFLPIYLSVYNVPKFFKSHNAIFSFLVDVVALFIVLIVCSVYTKGFWFFTIALPISVVSLTIPLVIIIAVRYLKISKWFKTSICLAYSGSIFYAINAIIATVLKDVADFKSIYKINFLSWGEQYISGNVLFILFLTIMLFAIAFCVVGILALSKLKRSSKV